MINPQGCSELHAMVDLFLDRELKPDQLTSFTSHLRECPELARILASQTALRTRLREAVRAASPSPPSIIKSGPNSTVARFVVGSTGC